MHLKRYVLPVWKFPQSVWTCFYCEMESECLNVKKNSIIDHFYFYPLKSPFTGAVRQWKYTSISMEAEDLELFTGQENLTSLYKASQGCLCFVISERHLVRQFFFYSTAIILLEDLLNQNWTWSVSTIHETTEKFYFHKCSKSLLENQAKCLNH